MKLYNFNADEFLKHYWQKKPVLLTQAFDVSSIEVDQNDLAGLSLEDTIESRIIFQDNDNWQLLNGPFLDNDFKNLADKKWTLLIQALNEVIPEVNKILDAFTFLPTWRLDDIMASYAVRGGSVGPHFDYYDVFLIQVSGMREWKLGQKCDESTKLKPDTELSIIDQFETLQTLTVKAGDVLYIPSKIAHWGTALDDQCMTYSVGFRAPSYREVISDLSDYLSSCIPSSKFYKDSALLTTRNNPAEIFDQDVQQLRFILSELSKANNADIARWLGANMTEAKYPEYQQLDRPVSTLQEILSSHIDLTLEESVRVAFYAADEGALYLFIAGEEICCASDSIELVKFITTNRQFNTKEIMPILTHQSAAQLFEDLYYQGYWYVAS